MRYFSESDLKSVGSLFPGFTAHGQQTSTGLIALAQAPETPPSQNHALKPPAPRLADASASLLKSVVRHANAKKDGLKERSEAWLRRGPRIAQLYRRPHLRKYAALDGSARQARRLIEEAKKNPALRKKLELKGVSQQTFKPDAPKPGRAARLYGALKEAHQLTSCMRPAAAMTKFVALKQIAPLLPMLAPV